MNIFTGTGDKYFGLGAQEKQQFYGPSRNDVTTAVTTTTNPSVSIQQHQDHHNKINDQQNTAMDSPGNNNNHSTLTTPTINAAAPSSVVDDYSFSNVFTNINLTSPGNQSPGGTLLTGHHHHHHSSDHHIAKRSKIRDTLIEWYGRTFPNKADKYTPPNLDYETNLAPRGVNYGGTTTSQNEWVVSNSFAPNGIYVKHDTSYTHRRREVMKMSLGVMVMVVMCTIFGVTISELKKANAALPKVGGSGSPLNGMVPVPLTDLSSTRIEPITARPTTLAPASLAPATLAPSDSPTLAPLSVSPTKPPLTRSPVAGNYALHVKTSDGTAWPTRSPRTSRPSNVSLI
jgi:hypothetical protein